MVDDISFQERIYDLINGYLDLTNYPVAESQFVKCEFCPGSDCYEAYGHVLDAYEHLYSRLPGSTSEDEDVEIILNEMNAIMKYVSIKMFQYGVYFARQVK